MGAVTTSTPPAATADTGAVVGRSASIETLRWPGLDATGALEAVITTRHGGVSEGPWASANLGLHVGDHPDKVIENRHRAAAAVGLPLDALVFCHQSHGTTVAAVTADDAGRGTRTESDALADVDAIVTTESSVGLVIMVADCVPMVLVDPQARVLAAVHAGWRGTVGGIAQVAIGDMVRHGADPSRIVVGIGPAVHPDEYQVGEEVAAGIVSLLGADPTSPAGAPILRTDQPDADSQRRWRCDLAGANASLLVACGINPENIHTTGRFSGDGDFFSDRQERPCGRFAVMAHLLADQDGVD